MCFNVFQDKTIEALAQEIDQLLKKRDQLKPNPELLKLIVEQDKLKYRIKILEQVKLKPINLNKSRD